MLSETGQAPCVCHPNHIPVIASVPFSQHPAQAQVRSSGTLGKGIYTEYKEGLSVAILQLYFFIAKYNCILLLPITTHSVSPQKAWN